jgi:hypothetical protein
VKPVTISTAPASRWPAHAAYCAATIFIGASGAINVTYGWVKGSDLPGQLTWAAVAGAVATVFALSWPALIRSLEARRWSAAAMALAALTLSGAYSVTAALGSAAGGRMQAERTETATTGAQDRAQTAYRQAEAELAKLAPTRTVGELEAVLAAAQLNPRTKGCAGDGRSSRVTCPKLEAELARARQRERLKADMTEAGKYLNAGPAKVANSDAKALAGYLQALGFAIDDARINRLLVLLAVLMIEAGGGLSLAVGMALAAPPVAREQLPPPAPAPGLPAPEHAPAAMLNTPLNTGGAAFGTPVFRVSDASETRAPEPPPVQVSVPLVEGASIMALVRDAGGILNTTTRRLGVQLGRPAATVHGELRRLAAGGLIKLNADRRGTNIVLLSPGRPH